MGIVHNKVATLPDEPGKEVNKLEWNEDHVIDSEVAFGSNNATGLNFARNTATSIALATGALVPTSAQVIVQAESGTTDTLDNITNTNTAEFDLLYLYADTGDEIIVTHEDATSTEIHLIANRDMLLHENKALVLRRKGTEWHEIAGPFADFHAHTSKVQRLPGPVLDEVLEDFTTGHGWTSDNAAVVLTDETTIGETGLGGPTGGQSIKLVTDGTNTLANVDSPSLTAIDMTGRYPGVWIKSDNPVIDMDNLDLEISSSGAFGTDKRRYFLMGLAARQVLVRDGEWALVTFAYNDVESTTGSTDRTAITAFRFRVQDNTIAATLRIGGVVAIQEAPQHAVVIQFDDGFLSDITRAAPKMAEYGFKGIAFAPFENLTGGSNMTVAQAKELHDAYEFDIGTHGSDSWENGGTTEMLKEVVEDRRAKKAAGITRGVEHATWPSGNSDEPLWDALAAFCITSRSTRNVPQASPPSNPMVYHGQKYNSTIATSAIKTDIDNAMAAGELLTIYFHAIVASGATGVETDQVDFDDIIDYLNTVGANVVSMTEYADQIRTILRDDNTGYTIVKKRADQTVNNSTTLIDDLHLKFKVRANTTYSGHILFRAVGATATEDMDLALTIPSGTALWHDNFDQAGATWLDATSERTFAVGTGNGSYTMMFFTIDIGATGGIVQVQWAQNVAGANDTTMKAGAFMAVTQVT